MKTILGALAVTVALIAGIGAVNAMPVSDISTELETVFEPKD